MRFSISFKTTNTRKAICPPFYRRTFWHSTILILLCLSLALRPRPVRAYPGEPVNPGGQPVHVILMLREQAHLTINAVQPGEAGKGEQRQAVLAELQMQASDSQSATLDRLEELRAGGSVEQVDPLWVANAIAVTVQPEELARLTSLPGVVDIVPDSPLRMTDEGISSLNQSPASNSLAMTQPNLAQVNAPVMWKAGYTGKGVVVANVDSGVSLNNADLAAKWRKGSNSWYDPHGEHTTPFDSSGHGTATMGIMVGTTYGMAPDAQWIAVKLFSDSGVATVSDALKAFQWLLDPDQNPLTNDAPDVVNNSWSDSSVGCTENPAMHSALQALLAAGILPIFSAGNWGPNPSSDPFPSNYPEVLAVGAVDANDQILSFSSRGPTSCRPAGQFFPDLVAPGNNIPSAGLQTGSMVIQSGTSFSAPHVAGALALLLSAYPNLSPTEQRNLLRTGAIQVSGQPDNTYGYGRLDVQTAYTFALFEQGLPAPYSLYMPLSGR